MAFPPILDHFTSRKDFVTKIKRSKSPRESSEELDWFPLPFSAKSRNKASLLLRYFPFSLSPHLLGKKAAFLLTCTPEISSKSILLSANIVTTWSESASVNPHVENRKGSFNLPRGKSRPKFFSTFLQLLVIVDFGFSGLPPIDQSEGWYEEIGNSWVNNHEQNGSESW